MAGAFAVAAGGWFFRPRWRGGAGWLLNALLAGGASLVSALVGGAPLRVNTFSCAGREAELAGC